MVCSYGLYSYGLHSYGLYSYGRYSYGLHSYGLHSHGLYSYGPVQLMACICHVLAMCASVTHFSRELVREPQLDQKKISTPSFLHCRAQNGSKGPFFLSLSA